MALAAVHDVRLHYQRREGAGGLPVVLVHGLAANLAFWYLTVVPALPPDLPVVLYDLRGHGRSEMPRTQYTTADMAEDLHALLGHLAIDRAHLVGHSFGGSVALHLAVLHPEEVASLVLADARVAALQPWPRDVSRLAQLPDLAGAAPLSPRAPARRPRPDRGRRRWRQLLDQTTARRDIAQEAGLTRERIASLGTESLLIYGSRSHCLPSCDGLGATLGRSRTVLVPDAGHFHPVERPVLFAREVQAFVRGVG